jgi:hypothetical protein
VLRRPSRSPRSLPRPGVIEERPTRLAPSAEARAAGPDLNHVRVDENLPTAASRPLPCKDRTVHGLSLLQDLIARWAVLAAGVHRAGKSIRISGAAMTLSIMVFVAGGVHPDASGEGT